MTSSRMLNFIFAAAFTLVVVTAAQAQQQKPPPGPKNCPPRGFAYATNPIDVDYDDLPKRLCQEYLTLCINCPGLQTNHGFESCLYDGENAWVYFCYPVEGEKRVPYNEKLKACLEAYSYCDSNNGAQQKPQN